LSWLPVVGWLHRLTEMVWPPEDGPTYIATLLMCLTPLPLRQQTSVLID